MRQRGPQLLPGGAPPDAPAPVSSPRTQATVWRRMIGTEPADPSLAPARTGAHATAGPLSRRPSPAQLTVSALMLAGLVLRVIAARQSLFADELSTYWIVTQHGLGGVMDLLYSTGRIHHAEITPPLFFIASSLTSQLGHAPELVRLPSLIAGTLAIPTVYAVGRRTVGERAGLLGAALTSLSRFMIFYSSEARSYALLILLAAFFP